VSIHAGYRCRDSGACCSSGWPIPVEAPLYERLAGSLTDGSLTVVQRLDQPSAPSAQSAAGAPSTTVAPPAPTAPSAPFAPFAPSRALPEGAAAVLGQTDDGRCVFYEADARRCRIHRLKGHASLPVACQQFPRVCLIDARGIHITLSHYCPTAAGLLFEETPLAIVCNPPGFPPDLAYEGLDARDAFPPLLRPGVLMDWETLDAFEAHAVRILDAETDSVDAALARIEALTERLRDWRATDGPLLATLEDALTAPDAPGAHGAAIMRTSGTTIDFDVDVDFDQILKLDAEVRGAVPADGVIQNAAPRAVIEAHERWVHPAWATFTRPLCRFLAAKLFANWCWYQGQGLRSLVRSLHAALAVLRVEAARQTLAQGRMLDQPLLREAFQRTDLLLVHLCSQEALARGWAAAEMAPAPGPRGRARGPAPSRDPSVHTESEHRE